MSRKKVDTRTAVLEAARRQLEKEGTSVRLEDVAREAGVSRQTVYLHFGSRVGLFEALVEHIDEADQLRESGRCITEAPDALAALDAVVEHRAGYIPYVQPVVQRLIEDRRRDPAAAAAYASRTAARRREYAMIVARLKAEDRLAPGFTQAAAADTMLVLLSIPTWELFTAECSWSEAQYAKRLKAILRRTLVKDGASLM